MSYRDPKQSIKQPVCKLVNGINEFSLAVDSRFISRDWRKEHINELILLVKELTDIKYKLLRLAEETW